MTESRSGTEHEVARFDGIAVPTRRLQAVLAITSKCRYVARRGWPLVADDDVATRAQRKERALLLVQAAVLVHR